MSTPTVSGRSPLLGAVASRVNKLVKHFSGVTRQEAIERERVNAEQMKILEREGTAWHILANGTLADLMSHFTSADDCRVYERGVMGENVLHLALLFNNERSRAMATYMIQLYGERLVNAPYQIRKKPDDRPGDYEGEVPLHIAIVNNDLEMCKLLVDQCADIHAMAFGPFFQKGGDCFFGMLPLSFAASVGNLEIMRFLVEAGADMNAYGESLNTALHMSVIHDQLDAYDLLISLGANTEMMNEDGFSPLVLAVALGKVSTFQHIYRSRRKVEWKYGPITQYKVPLAEMDTVGSDDAGQKLLPFGRLVYRPSALDIVTRLEKKEMFDDRLISELTLAKWEKFGKMAYSVHLCFFFVYVVNYTAIQAIIASGNQADYGTLLDVMEPVSVLCSVLNSLVHIRDVYVWACDYHNTKRHNLTTRTEVIRPLYKFPTPGAGQNGESKNKPPLTKDMSGMERIKKMGGIIRRITVGGSAGMADYMSGRQTLLQYLDATIWTVPHLGFPSALAISTFKQEYVTYAEWVFNLSVYYHYIERDPLYDEADFSNDKKLKTEKLQIIKAFGALAGWLAMAQFFAGNRRIGVLWTVVRRCVRDIEQWLILFMVSFLGFYTAFIILLRVPIKDDSKTLVGFALECVRLLFGLDDFYEGYISSHEYMEENKWVQNIAQLVYTMFILLENLLLLNIIIAMFSKTFDTVTSNSESEWLLEYLKMILRMERRLTMGMQETFRLGTIELDEKEKPSWWYTFKVNENSVPPPDQPDRTWGTEEESISVEKAKHWKQIGRGVQAANSLHNSLHGALARAQERGVAGESATSLGAAASSILASPLGPGSRNQQHIVPPGGLGKLVKMMSQAPAQGTHDQEDELFNVYGAEVRVTARSPQPQERTAAPFSGTVSNKVAPLP